MLCNVIVHTGDDTNVRVIAVLLRQGGSLFVTLTLALNTAAQLVWRPRLYLILQHARCLRPCCSGWGRGVTLEVTVGWSLGSWSLLDQSTFESRDTGSIQPAGRHRRHACVDLWQRSEQVDKGRSRRLDSDILQKHRPAPDNDDVLHLDT